MRIGIVAVGEDFVVPVNNIAANLDAGEVDSRCCGPSSLKLDAVNEVGTDSTSFFRLCVFVR